MQIVVPINPTIVNVLTDLFLVVLQLLWGRAMMKLTAADIRRSLRLGAPLPTYEHLGTHRYFSTSFSNYERHKASLESMDKRWFRWSILKGLVALLFTAGMVALHLVIDLGLDFDTQMKLTNRTQTYEMVGLQGRPEYIEDLSEFSVILSEGLDAVHEQCDTEQLTSRECRQLARDEEDYRTSRIFEGVSFSKMLFTESLLGSVDVLEELTFDYRPVRLPVGEKKEDFPECHVEEERDLEDFRGSWRLSHSGCALSEVKMKGVVIDMRARAAFQRSRSDTSAGKRFEREYNSFENFKDVNMTATKSSVQTLEVPDVEQLEPELKTMQRARLTVDSGVKYLPGEQQRINITVLASTDEKRNFKPVLWRSDPVEVASDEHSDNLCPGLRSTMTEFKNSTVRFGGEECAHHTFRSMGKCSTNETPFVYYTSYTSMHQVYTPSSDANRREDMISDDCGDLAFDEFFGGQTSGESESIKRYLYLGSLMVSACAVRKTEDGRYEKMCAMGSEYVRWDGSEWSEVAAEDFNNSTDIQLEQQVTAAAIEITGGDPSQIRDAVANVAAILSGVDYANFKKFTAGSSSPRKIFGASPQHDSKALLSAMVTQIGQTNRTVYVYEQVPVSVLKGAYVYTIAMLIVVTLAALAISIFRQAQEFKRSRNNLLAEKKIPFSKTDWVEFVLKLLTKGSADEIAHCAIYSYEYTSRLDEPDFEKGNREEGDHATGKIGFFKGPEPLKAGADYK